MNKTLGKVYTGMDAAVVVVVIVVVVVVPLLGKLFLSIYIHRV